MRCTCTCEFNELLVTICFFLHAERGHIIIGKLRELQVCLYPSVYSFFFYFSSSLLSTPMQRARLPTNTTTSLAFILVNHVTSIVTVCPHTTSVRSTATAVQTVSMNNHIVHNTHDLIVLKQTSMWWQCVGIIFLFNWSIV